MLEQERRDPELQERRQLQKQGMALYQELLESPNYDDVLNFVTEYIDVPKEDLIKWLNGSKDLSVRVGRKIIKALMHDKESKLLKSSDKAHWSTSTAEQNLTILAEQIRTDVQDGKKSKIDIENSEQ